ncbi:MAG TPA: hypothetical protein VMC42_04015 [Methanoregulaceae archaeon]|nr:hypothetical protein [Methanoregulaceae archaeon]
MYDVTSAKKMENGVIVYYDSKETREYESFSYEELIDQKINALDMIQNPGMYSIDSGAHKLYMKDI